MSLFVLTIEQANRSVSLLGFNNQAASATCQAAWLQNMSLAKVIGSKSNQMDWLIKEVICQKRTLQIDKQRLGVISFLSYLLFATARFSDK